jgi:hypothetical protein
MSFTTTLSSILRYNELQELLIAGMYRYVDSGSAQLTNVTIR